LFCELFHCKSYYQKFLNNEKHKINIDCLGDTQFKVQQREGSLWSCGDEICIFHIFKPKASGIPVVDHIQEFIGYLGPFCNCPKKVG